MKGKYATRAVNRTAAIDNEVIVELRTKLEDSEQENHALREEVAVLTGKLTGSVAHEAAILAQREIKRLCLELDQQRDLNQELVESLAFDLLDLYAEHNCYVGDGGNPDKFNSDFAELFGLSARLGELLDYIASRSDRQKRDNRKGRRATSTARKIRHQRSRLTDAQRNPGRFGSKAPKGGLYYGRVTVHPDDMGLPR